MKILKIYESYDVNAFDDFKYHAREKFGKDTFSVLYQKYYDGVDFIDILESKVDRNKMGQLADKMETFLAHHLSQWHPEVKDTQHNEHMVSHITEDERVFDMMLGHMAGASYRKLQHKYEVNYGKIFRWLRDIDELCLSDDRVAEIALSVFYKAKYY